MLKLNKTNLKNVLGGEEFNVDKGYLITKNFVLKITNPEDEKILINMPMNKKFTYESVIPFTVMKGDTFYKTKKTYCGDYNDFPRPTIKLSNFNFGGIVDLRFIELFNLLNYNLFNSRSINIEKHLIYIKDYGVMAGLKL